MRHSLISATIVLATILLLLGIFSFAHHKEPIATVTLKVETPKTATPSATPIPTKQPEEVREDIKAEQHIISLVNDQRVSHGLPPVIEIATLDGSAYLKALDLEQQWEASRKPFSHYDSKGRWFTGFIQDAGWRGSAAENLAVSYSTDEETVDAWMASPGHRENILQVNAIYAGYAQVGSFRVLHLGGYH